MNKDAISKGMGFGITSAIITTMGLIVGTHSSTNLQHAVVAAILVIAFADSMADAFGVYSSERGRDNVTTKDALISMVAAFITKFIFALTFIIPIILISNLHTAIIIDLIYGIGVLIFVNYKLAKKKKENIFKTIILHVGLAVLVVVGSHYLGQIINNAFGN
jgi:VIT1/CCC1 family predicted Fe2+/Mn2+ transporter